nr:MAG TPA: hypothetical protein [Bacteriophage sp.]
MIGIFYDHKLDKTNYIVQPSIKKVYHFFPKLSSVNFSPSPVHLPRTPTSLCPRL